MPVAIGLDIGGTKILGGLVDSAGRVLHEVRVATPAEDGADGIMAALAEAAGQVRQFAATQGETPVGIGVSSAGHVVWETGQVVDGTPNVPGWAGMRVAENLTRATGMAACCDNDGNAAAFGEAWVGAGRSCKAIVAITLGTGFGAGIFDRGHMLRGSRGGGAELGHLIVVPDGRPCNCGQSGCVEAYVSGTALAKQARSLWGPQAGSPLVFERAAEGDGQALELVDEFARMLALTMVSIFNLADPDLILIGGGIAAQEGLFLPAVRRRVTRYLGGKRFSADQIRLAQLGQNAGMIGAAGQALARFGVAASPVEDHAVVDTTS
ncbi:MAG: ROK family protein [Candidatus Sericytochromatia bacterium]|uniref:ROK family protein n=1 Tax=Candidatus Tanganyikabacteria bacterium TaxID=2961651 RepID=A0A938BK98_9BACT|nr:ROK family protein [Candidatus Tanganyikabacteria bacterium]